jgi:hypothetical protein
VAESCTLPSNVHGGRLPGAGWCVVLLVMKGVGSIATSRAGMLSCASRSARTVYADGPAATPPSAPAEPPSAAGTPASAAVADGTLAMASASGAWGSSHASRSVSCSGVDFTAVLSPSRRVLSIANSAGLLAVALDT